MKKSSQTLCFQLWEHTVLISTHHLDQLDKNVPTATTTTGNYCTVGSLRSLLKNFKTKAGGWINTILSGTDWWPTCWSCVGRNRVSSNYPSNEVRGEGWMQKYVYSQPFTGYYFCVIIQNKESWRRPLWGLVPTPKRRRKKKTKQGARFMSAE